MSEETRPKQSIKPEAPTGAPDPSSHASPHTSGAPSASPSEDAQAGKDAPQEGEAGPAKPRFAERFTGVRWLKEAFTSARDGAVRGDGQTRFLSWAFFASCFALLLLGSATIHQIFFRLEQSAELSEEERARREIESYLSQSVRNSEHTQSMVTIGRFTFQVKVEPGSPRWQGVFNQADVEIVAECDSEETCAFLESHLVRVRNEVTRGLITMTRDELLSSEGKLLLKQNIREKVNKFLPKGKVEGIYFSDFVIT